VTELARKEDTAQPGSRLEDWVDETLETNVEYEEKAQII